MKRKLRLKDELLREMERLEQEAAPVLAATDPAAAADAIDRATVVAGKALLYSLRFRVISHRREIEAALARVESGQYGSCLECGDAIEPRRLRAVPWAERCVCCQANSERGVA